MITDITVPRMMNNVFFATTNIAFQVLYNQLTNLVMLVKISLGVNSMRDIKRCVSSVFHIFIYFQFPIEYNGDISIHSTIHETNYALIVDIYMNVTKVMSVRYPGQVPNFESWD
jgi:hypothetical protein